MAGLGVLWAFYELALGLALVPELICISTENTTCPMQVIPWDPSLPSLCSTTGGTFGRGNEPQPVLKSFLNNSWKSSGLRQVAAAHGAL